MGTGDGGLLTSVGQHVQGTWGFSAFGAVGAGVDVDIGHMVSIPRSSLCPKPCSLQTPEQAGVLALSQTPSSCTHTHMHAHTCARACTGMYTCRGRLGTPARALPHAVSWVTLPGALMRAALVHQASPSVARFWVLLPGSGDLRTTCWERVT